MDKKEILDLLDMIHKKRNRGTSVDFDVLKKDGFKKDLITKCQQWELIDWSGTDFYLTQIGFNTLNQSKISKDTEQLKKLIDNFSKFSKQQSRDMINHTKKLNESIKEFGKQSSKDAKEMRNLTVAILLLTAFLVVNAIPSLESTVAKFIILLFLIFWGGFMIFSVFIRRK